MEKEREIIEFSELEGFIDAPVQSYSSGMRVRLGFAIALHMEPDVLLIDEVLAVGDARFRQKARNSVHKIISKDAAVIFCSHSMHQIASFTENTIWMDAGKIIKIGKSEQIVQEYILDQWVDNESDNEKKSCKHKLTHGEHLEEVAPLEGKQALPQHTFDPAQLRA